MTDVPSPTANPTVILIEFQQPFYFFFFPRASPLSISSLLPVIQQFIPLYTNPSIRQLLILFMTAATHSAGVWGSLFLLLLNRNLSQTCFGFQAPALFQPWEASWVLTLYWSILSAQLMTALQEFKKGDKNGNLEPRGSETGSDCWNLNQLWNALENIWKIGVCYL